MEKTPKQLDRLIDSLEERVKELNCLYEVEEILRQGELSFEDICQKIVRILPAAYQYPSVCHAKIVYREAQFTSDDYEDSPWALNADINVQDRTVGWIRVCYSEEKPETDIGPFLLEEKRLLDSIAQRLGHHVMYEKLKKVFFKWETTKQDMSTSQSGEWQIILELLRRTDIDLFIRISRKMLNYLIWNGVEEAELLLQKFNPYSRYAEEEVMGESNRPLEKHSLGDVNTLSKQIFEVASLHLDNALILSRIQKWMQEDRTAFLVRAVSNNDSSLTDIADAIRRYFQLNPEGMQLSPSARIGVRAALIRRFFSDQLEFINIAKNYCRVIDFNEILHRIIFPTGSHGKLGGKSAGVFLSYRILQEAAKKHDILKNIKTPKTWYISSDAMIHFMHYNNLEEILEQKYKPIDEVRKEYPHVVQLFKNSHFPAELVQGLSMALDDFEDKPLVVRSSSLLEDRLGSAFSGKYKSLFIANQGSKSKRLEALMDAIAEVYASTIAPDPIEYRAERGLLDFHEEMGIMIQEVVGEQVGDYFFPAFAGVAFSNNEFRWSPRIRREDGLIRMVPGLGTRAVDRVSNDYPVLLAPGQPGLRANVSLDEIIHYSPQMIDVVNLKENKFETIALRTLFRKYGEDYPSINKVVSILEHNHLAKPSFDTDYSAADPVVTFEGLINETSFIKQLHTILRELQNALASPVDIEFASDGRDFYLLQCRPQSYSKHHAPAEIPESIPKEKLLFSAQRYITNGAVTNIKYIVYVDPEKYNNISDHDQLKSIGRIIGQLNKLLPRREFILMGPGRWGSRGDIKLGVNVTYSDINNTAMLVEIARKKGNYVPDLSFGTHFFQDLVEASIHYLPLYPDDPGIVFNKKFFSEALNALFDFLPGYSYLGDVVHVIEIPRESDGQVLNIFMNSDQENAVGVLAPPVSAIFSDSEIRQNIKIDAEDHWRWRMHMAEKIAEQLEPDRFGVKALYILGSTKNSTASAGSDIDLLVHFKGSKEQKKELRHWLEGWSLSLDEINFLRTGFKAGGILDVRFADDKEIADKNAIAQKFNLDDFELQELPLALLKD